MREQVTMSELLSTQTFASRAATYFRMPGIVKAYHPPVQGVSPAAVDVQPAVNDVRFDTTTGERYSEPWPVLYRIPVRFPTFGGFAIWGPLKVDDKVDLEGFDLDPGPYLASGQQSDPAMTRRNGGAHWVAVPGDYTDPGALPDPGKQPANNTSIPQICFGTPGGVIVSVGADGKVNLGSAAPTDSVGLALKIDADFSALSTFLGDLKTWSVAVAGALSAAGFPIAVDQGHFVTAITTAQGAIVATGSSVVKCAP